MDPRVDVDVGGVYQHTDAKENQENVNSLEITVGSSLVVEKTGEDEAERHAGH